MEIKKYNKQSVDGVVEFLYRNAINTSRPKAVNDKSNQTPEEEGYAISDFSELDISFSNSYQSVFIKAFFGKKSFRWSIGIHELPKWYSIHYSLATRNDSNDDLILEE